MICPYCRTENAAGATRCAACTSWMVERPPARTGPARARVGSSQGSRGGSRTGSACPARRSAGLPALDPVRGLGAARIRRALDRDAARAAGPAAGDRAVRDGRGLGERLSEPAPISGRGTFREAKCASAGDRSRLAQPLAEAPLSRTARSPAAGPGLERHGNPERDLDEQPQPPNRNRERGEASRSRAGHAEPLREPPRNPCDEPTLGARVRSGVGGRSRRPAGAGGTAGGGRAF